MHIHLWNEKRERRYQRAVAQGFDLTSAETARYMDVSIGWLEQRRKKDDGPKYRKLSSGQIRYSRPDLDSFMPGGVARNLTRKSAAKFLGRSVSFLEKAAKSGTGPLYKVFGPGLMRYPLAELATYSASLTQKGSINET